MSVHVMKLVEPYEDGREYGCLLDATTGRLFGPRLDSVEEAELFVDHWASLDPTLPARLQFLDHPTITASWLRMQRWINTWPQTPSGDAVDAAWILDNSSHEEIDLHMRAYFRRHGLHVEMVEYTSGADEAEYRRKDELERDYPCGCAACRREEKRHPSWCSAAAPCRMCR